MKARKNCKKPIIIFTSLVVLGTYILLRNIVTLFVSGVKPLAVIRLPKSWRDSTPLTFSDGEFSSGFVDALKNLIKSPQ